MKTKVTMADAVQISDQEISVSLFDFKSASLPDCMHFNHVDARVCPEENALKVVMKSRDHFYTSIFLEPETPWDWSGLLDFCFAFDAENHGERSAQLFINVFDVKGQMHTRSLNLAPGDVRTNLVELKGETLDGGLNYASGMRSNPAPWPTDGNYGVWMWGTMNLDLTGIRQIEIGVHGVLMDHSLTLKNFRLLLSPEPAAERLIHVVDRYGQNAQVEFEGKIHSDAELAEAARLELEQLKAGSMADRSTFSGFRDGPKFEATGYFRTEKRAGKWSLVDPEGYLYFATGLDVIRLANASTMTGADFAEGTIAERDADELIPEDSVENIHIGPAAAASRFVAHPERHALFEWLPEYGDLLAAHYSYIRETMGCALPQGETFTFYGANLQRKYGEGYLEKWREVTVDRMLNWGFTSLGNWTAPEFYSNGRIPFFANGWIIGDFKTVSSGDDFWGALPDPFDPVFRERAEATAARVKAEVQDSPWCVGIFIDNEKSWGRMGTDFGQYGIVVCTLGRDAAVCPAKSVFTALMKEKYQTIEALNAAWAMELPSWEVFAAGVTAEEYSDVKKADYSLMLEAFATEYFRVVRECVKEELPNHLYLGSRFADWGVTPETIRAAAKYCDVVSFNYYKEGLHPKAWMWQLLPEIDRPCIIGEFHIGATDTGFFHPGLVMAGSQAERGLKYQDYMRSVIDNPYFVGAHWFQYLDSPITGRACDGENYNIGFVATTDVPYEPVVAAAKELHAAMYRRRYG